MRATFGEPMGRLTMRELITDEMVEAAARAAFGDGFMRGAPEYENRDLSDYDDGIRESWRVVARAALTAAAPQIAATALRDAADAWQWGEWSTITEPAKRPEQAPRVLGIASAVADWIRARAERIEKEDA